MTITLSTDIQSSNWSMSTTTDGAVVQNLADLAQQVQNVLVTEKGSLPYDPDFGFDIQKLVDRPVNFVIPNGKLGILDAIEYGVPLVGIERVDHQYLPSDPANVVFIVYCSSNLGNFGVAISTSPNFTVQSGQGQFLGGFSGGFSSGFNTISVLP